MPSVRNSAVPVGVAVARLVKNVDNIDKRLSWVESMIQYYESLIEYYESTGTVPVGKSPAPGQVAREEACLEVWKPSEAEVKRVEAYLRHERLRESWSEVGRAMDHPRGTVSIWGAKGRELLTERGVEADLLVAEILDRIQGG